MSCTKSFADSTSTLSPSNLYTNSATSSDSPTPYHLLLKKSFSFSHDRYLTFRSSSSFKLLSWICFNVRCYSPRSLYKSFPCIYAIGCTYIPSTEVIECTYYLSAVTSALNQSIWSCWFCMIDFNSFCMIFSVFIFVLERFDSSGYMSLRMARRKFVLSVYSNRSAFS